MNINKKSIEKTISALWEIGVKSKLSLDSVNKINFIRENLLELSKSSEINNFIEKNNSIKNVIIPRYFAENIKTKERFLVDSIEGLS